MAEENPTFSPLKLNSMMRTSFAGLVKVAQWCQSYAADPPHLTDTTTPSVLRDSVQQISSIRDLLSQIENCLTKVYNIYAQAQQQRMQQQYFELISPTQNAAQSSSAASRPGAATGLFGTNAGYSQQPHIQPPGLQFHPTAPTQQNRMIHSQNRPLMVPVPQPRMTIEQINQLQQQQLLAQYQLQQHNARMIQQGVEPCQYGSNRPLHPPHFGMRLPTVVRPATSESSPPTHNQVPRWQMSVPSTDSSADQIRGGTTSTQNTGEFEDNTDLMSLLRDMLPESVTTTDYSCTPVTAETQPCREQNVVSNQSVNTHEIPQVEPPPVPVAILIDTPVQTERCDTPDSICESIESIDSVCEDPDADPDDDDLEPVGGGLVTVSNVCTQTRDRRRSRPISNDVKITLSRSTSAEARRQQSPGRAPSEVINPTGTLAQVVNKRSPFKTEASSQPTLTLSQEQRQEETHIVAEGPSEPAQLKAEPADVAKMVVTARALDLVPNVDGSDAASSDTSSALTSVCGTPPSEPALDTKVEPVDVVTRVKLAFPQMRRQTGRRTKRSLQMPDFERFRLQNPGFRYADETVESETVSQPEYDLKEIESRDWTVVIKEEDRRICNAFLLTGNVDEQHENAPSLPTVIDPPCTSQPSDKKKRLGPASLKKKNGPQSVTPTAARRTSVPPTSRVAHPTAQADNLAFLNAKRDRLAGKAPKRHHSSSGDNGKKAKKAKLVIDETSADISEDSGDKHEDGDDDEATEEETVVEEPEDDEAIQWLKDYIFDEDEDDTMSEREALPNVTNTSEVIDTEEAKDGEMAKEFFADTLLNSSSSDEENVSPPALTLPSSSPQSVTKDDNPPPSLSPASSSVPSTTSSMWEILEEEISTRTGAITDQKKKRGRRRKWMPKKTRNNRKAIIPKSQQGEVVAVNIQSN